MRLFSIATLLVLLAPLTHATGFIIEPLQDTVAGSQFADAYASRQFSVATAVNNSGQLIGYQRRPDGQYRSFGVATGDNPALTVVDTPDFLALSAGDAACFWQICATEFAFGIQVWEGGPLTSFVGDDVGSSVLPGSLPFSRFPGSFVEENAAGVVASTQYGGGEQFGALVGGHGVTLLPGVRWLVAINDNQPAQALGYVGKAGDCLVFGYACDPAPHECDDDGDGHSNDRGVGHHSHGRGYGYGHDDCHAGEEMLSASAPAAGYPVLLAMDAEGGASTLRFPATVGNATVAHAFPVAMNQHRALLLGTLAGEQHSRVLSCQFSATNLDGNGDGEIDCSGGLGTVAVDGQLPLGTVLGFSLNNQDLLMANAGFSAAGLGVPLVADLASEAPVLTLLANYLPPGDALQVSVVTDVNDAGMASAYGYAACGDEPEAVRMLPAAAPAGQLRFVPGHMEQQARLAPGENFSLAPQATGAGGSVLFRYQWLDPENGQWVLLQDWSDLAYQGTAPIAAQDLCFRVDVADSVDMNTRRSQLLRYRVSDEQAPATVQPGPVGEPAVAGAAGDAIAEALPTLGAGWSLALLLLAARRRQAA